MKNRMITSEDTHFQPSVYPAKEIKRYLPEVRVSFHTETKCYQTAGRKLVRGEVRDPTYQLLSVTTQKTLSSPAGAFTVTLAGDQWGDRLKSNDLVVIRMGYMGEAMLSTVMIGLIDRIQVRRTATGGKPSVQTVVAGRDFGKMLLKSQLKFYPEIGANNKSAEKYFLTEEGWIQMLGIFGTTDMVEGTPDVILKKIIEVVLPKLNSTVWTIYDEQKTIPTAKKVGVTNLMTWQFEKTNFFLPFYQTADSFEGSIWNLMERATQKPFTELYIDTVDGKALKASTVTPATATTTTTTTTTTSDKYHTVVKGDTLWALASKFYGKGTEWRKIWEANKTMLIARDKRNATDHGHWIYPGQKLRITGVQETSTTTKTVAPAPQPPTQEFGFDNGKVMLTYRMTPFDTAKWDALPKHLLKAEDVLDEDLGRSDDEHYNVFWAGTTLSALGDTNIRMVSPPLMNEEDVKRYGISPLEVEIEGLAIDRAKEAEHKVALENLSNTYTKILKTWYQDNHKYYSGSVTSRGRGDFRIGQRIDYEPMNIEGYIEGVSHNFSVFSDWTTAITVTRGVKKPKAPTNSAKPATSTTSTASTTPATPATPTTPTPNSTTVTTDKYHTVVKGDTLWAIAVKYYGKGPQWQKIWEANKNMLIARDKRNATNHGHWIYPGQKLRIPA